MTMMVVAPAMAQDNFPDVPENHWAFDALAKMKRDGLLVGYPDGLFRGGRPASRYEMAVALHALYERLKGTMDGMQQQIDMIKGNSGGGSGVSNDQFQALKDSVAALEASVNNMKGWGDDVANMKKMASTFEKELASLGVDVEAMKKDLTDIQARLAKLEKTNMPVSIHGDVNLFVMAGISQSNRAGVTVDGRPVGVQDTIFTGGVLAPVGATQDLSVFHEAGVQLSGNASDNVKWNATLGIGNMIGGAAMSALGVPTGAGAWNGQAGTSVGIPFAEGVTDVYFQDFAVRWQDSLMKQNFSVAVGRQGYKVSPYIFQKPDNTPYFANSRWDSGEYILDGAQFGLNFGPAKLGIAAGRTSNRLSNNGVELTGLTAGAVQLAAGTAWGFNVGAGRPTGLGGGAMMVDQLLGLTLNVPLTDRGGVDLAYLFTEANVRGAGGANRTEIFGGEVNWNLGAIAVNGGYSQSIVKNGSANVQNKNNFAWHAGATYNTEKWGVEGYYREIMPFFGAPGDWGRIGMWWNPTDIKGFGAGAHLNLSDTITLKGMGQFYQGTGKVAGGLSTSDKINRFTADLGFKLNDAWTASVGGEWVEWNLKNRTGFTGGKPLERWYNLGLGYHLSDSAKLNIMWQVSDYDAKGVNSFNLFPTSGSASGARATGSLITTQLSVKF